MNCRMNNYAIYLRKSRADLDAEARGEGETLSRHRAALRALAERRGLFVAREYAEIVTGDSIAARPQMLLLLDDVRAGLYAGVIVNDVDRLGRGDSIDQEIIKAAFVAGGCIIITPGRDIDPASPTDQDMLDFSMFFARFELRKISQRLNQGRARSASSGNYLNPRVPVGYIKVVDGKRITLRPDPDRAPVVRMIFEWYDSGEAGFSAICHRLYDMGFKSWSGIDFSPASIRNMLTNPIYIGTVVWGSTATQKIVEDGRRVKRHIKNTPTVTENAHPAIVPRDLFDRVQQRIATKRHAAPTPGNCELRNPLAGLVRCSVCGKMMGATNRHKFADGTVKDLLHCRTLGCPTKSIYVDTVEAAVLDTLRAWCSAYDDSPEPPAPDDSERLGALQRQIDAARAQITRAQELVELGIYTPSEYIARRDTLLDRIATLTEALHQSPPPTREHIIRTNLPKIHSVLDTYPLATTPTQKNNLLKTVISKIVYTKTRTATKSIDPATLLTLDIYPKIGGNI